MKLEEVSIGSELYDSALELRYHLLFKQSGLPRSAVPDASEEASTHLSLSDNGILVGYSRMSALGADDYRISQVVVSPKYQGCGHSSTLLCYLMNKAIRAGAATIGLNSQLPIVGLYEKLGFKPIGEVYTIELTGVLHRKMIYHVNT
jgi:predicted GNAT family N-acyltransferase